MIHQGYAGRYRQEEEWRSSGAEICLQLGLTMVGLGLLYWGLVLAYAHTLASGWIAGLFETTDPLASLGDPFMWTLWLVYWSVALGLLRRGLGERRRGSRGA